MEVIIPGVVYELERKPDHEDQRRALCTMFNGDLGDFRAAQVKFSLMKIDAVLGGHYHTYRELFYLLDGAAEFVLQSTLDPALKQQFVLQKGSRLLIPSHIAHASRLKAGATLVGCTEAIYSSAAENDHPYQVSFE